jgi:hypothetical protein
MYFSTIIYQLWLTALARAQAFLPLLKAANDQLDDEDTADPDILEQPDGPIDHDTHAEAADDEEEESRGHEARAVDMVSTRGPACAMPLTESLAVEHSMRLIGGQNTNR